jgi:hypothetical protein
MSTHHVLTRKRHSIDNLHAAELLKAAAVDHMYTFQVGTRAVTVEEVSDHYDVTGRFMSHSWGCSIQLWAHGKHGNIAAAAESSAAIDELRGANIASRITQFRTGQLLWTHTAEPVSHHVITPELDTFVGSAPPPNDLVYRLAETNETDWHTQALKPIWILTAPGTDFEPVRFAGLVSAATWITTNLDGGRK